LKSYISPNNPAAGCNGIRDRTTCLTSRDGRVTPEWMGVRISDQPCIWCGGKYCTSHGDALCEPADFMLRGQALGVWKSGVSASLLEHATCAPTPTPTAPTQAPTSFSGNSVTLAPTPSPTPGGGNSGQSSGSGDSGSGSSGSSGGDSSSAGSGTSGSGKEDSGSASSGSSSVPWWAWVLLSFLALLSTFTFVVPVSIGNGKKQSKKGKNKHKRKDADPVLAVPPVHSAGLIYAVPAPTAAMTTSPLTFSPPVSAAPQSRPIEARVLPMSQGTPV